MAPCRKLPEDKPNPKTLKVADSQKSEMVQCNNTFFLAKQATLPLPSKAWRKPPCEDRHWFKGAAWEGH